MQEITTDELKKLLGENNNMVLLDCRASEKYNREHISGAVSLPLNALDEKYQEIIPDKNSLIITSCASYMCSTSINCYKKLRSLGYKNLLEYSGGITDWKANGFETVKGENL